MDFRIPQWHSHVWFCVAFIKWWWCWDDAQLLKSRCIEMEEPSGEAANILHSHSLPLSLTPFPDRWIIWSAPFEYVNARREGERGKNWMKTFLSLPFCSIHFTVTRKHRYKAVNLLRSMVYIAIILKTLCACCCFQFFCLFVFVIDLCMHTQTYLRTRTNSSSKTLYRIMCTFS